MQSHHALVTEIKTEGVDLNTLDLSKIVEESETIIFENNTVQQLTYLNPNKKSLEDHDIFAEVARLLTQVAKNEKSLNACATRFIEIHAKGYQLTAHALYQMGLASYLETDYVTALSHFTMALDHVSIDLCALDLHCLLLLHQGLALLLSKDSLKEAQKKFLEVMRIDSASRELASRHYKNLIDGWIASTSILLRQNNKVIASKITDPHKLVRLAEQYLTNGQYEQALAHMDLVFCYGEVMVSNVFFGLYAEIYYQQHNYRKAEEFLTLSIWLLTTDNQKSDQQWYSLTNSLIKRCLCNMQLGRWERASEDYCQYKNNLKNLPELDENKKNIAEIARKFCEHVSQCQTTEDVEKYFTMASKIDPILAATAKENRLKMLEESDSPKKKKKHHKAPAKLTTSTKKILSTTEIEQEKIREKQERERLKALFEKEQNDLTAAKKMLEEAAKLRAQDLEEQRKKRNERNKRRKKDRHDTDQNQPPERTPSPPCTPRVEFPIFNKVPSVYNEVKEEIQPLATVKFTILSAIARLMKELLPYQTFIVGGALRNGLIRQFLGYQTTTDDFDLVVKADDKPEQDNKFRQCGLKKTIDGVSYSCKIKKLAVGLWPSAYSIPDEDVKHRDFTINALYADSLGNVLDPTKGGLNDIRNRMIDTIIDADISFQEDPIRMLRAIKLFIKLEEYQFKFSKPVIEAIKKHQHLLIKVKAEVVNFWLTRLLQINSAKALLILSRQGLLSTLFPFLADDKLRDSVVSTFKPNINDKSPYLSFCAHLLLTLAKGKSLNEADTLIEQNPLLNNLRSSQPQFYSQFRMAYAKQNAVPAPKINFWQQPKHVDPKEHVLPCLTANDRGEPVIARLRSA